MIHQEITGKFRTLASGVAAFGIWLSRIEEIIADIDDLEGVGGIVSMTARSSPSWCASDDLVCAIRFIFAPAVTVAAIIAIRARLLQVQASNALRDVLSQLEVNM